jgi:Ser/Thr protein kinase RdoA (MazF antagonist)
MNEEQLLKELGSFNLAFDGIEKVPTLTLCAVYKVFSQNETYAAKVYPKAYSRDESTTEIEFASLLYNNGINVPKYFSHEDGNAFKTLSDGSTVAVSQWMEGKLNTRYSLSDIDKVSRALAKIHAVSRGANIDRPDEWLWSDAKKYLPRLKLASGLRDIFEGAVNKGRLWENASDNLQICHNDLTVTNILWQEDNPAFIDFTNAIRAPAEWDLCVFYASLVLSGVYDQSRIAPHDICRPYEQAGGVLDKTLFERLLPAAIAQRAIFMAFTGNEAQQAAILSRADREFQTQEPTPE